MMNDEAAITPEMMAQLPKALRIEIDENIHRKDFTETERAQLQRAIIERWALEAKRRQLLGRAAEPAQPRDVQAADPEGAPPSTTVKAKRRPNTTEKVAKLFGEKEATVRKRLAVVEAAEAEPERFGALPEQMDRTGVSGAWRKLKLAQDEKRIVDLAPISGKFKTLIIDPPWDYGELSLAGRAAPDYATMTHEQLLAMPVLAWAEEDCHLYLWTTNNFVLRAGELMAAWGFEFKTVLTWIKPRLGMGAYFRNTTEQVLFGVRGNLKTRSDAIPTHFAADLGQHSAKPEQFYDIVRRSSYLPAGEAFQRTARDGFVNVYRERRNRAAMPGELTNEPPVERDNDLVGSAAMQAGGGDF